MLVPVLLCACLSEGICSLLTSCYFVSAICLSYVQIFHFFWFPLCMLIMVIYAVVKYNQAEMDPEGFLLALVCKLWLRGYIMRWALVM